jgi:hypothetical protein
MVNYELKAKSIATEAPDTCTATITVHSRLPDEHPLHQQIGIIASKWAFFEHMLDVIIWDLMPASPDFGACITGQIMGHGNKFLTIIALLKHREFSTSLIGRFSKFMHAVGEAAEKRNRCIHDAWYEEVVTKTVHQYRTANRKDINKGPKKKLSLGFQEVGGQAALIETMSRLDAHITQLDSFRSEILAAPRT